MTSERNLTTALPDGSVVDTPWPEAGRPFSLSAQCAHAQEHRETVRWWLTQRGWRSLPAQTTRQEAA